jgi:hypothetical protein
MISRRDSVCIIWCEVTVADWSEFLLEVQWFDSTLVGVLFELFRNSNFFLHRDGLRSAAQGGKTIEHSWYFGSKRGF